MEEVHNEPEVRVCKNCGTPLEPGEIFCKHCGTLGWKIGDERVPTAENAAALQKAAAEAEAERLKREAAEAKLAAEKAAAEKAEQERLRKEAAEREAAEKAAEAERKAKAAAAPSAAYEAFLSAVEAVDPEAAKAPVPVQEKPAEEPAPEPTAPEAADPAEALAEEPEAAEPAVPAPEISESEPADEAAVEEAAEEAAEEAEAPKKPQIISTFDPRVAKINRRKTILSVLSVVALAVFAAGLVYLLNLINEANTRSAAETSAATVSQPAKTETKTQTDEETEDTGEAETSDGPIVYDVTTALAMQKEEELSDESIEGATECYRTGRINMYEVNVRTTPSTNGAVSTTVHKYDQVTITATIEDANGETWGEIQKGWIVLRYVDLDPDEGSSLVEGVTETYRTGVINYAEINVRSQPSTDSDLVTTLRKGAEVTVTETQDGDGYTWAKINQGWVVLKYIDLDPEVTEPPVSEEETIAQLEELLAGGQTAKAKIAVYQANIRTEPSSESEVVVQLDSGTEVTITEVEEVSDVVWVHVEDGWTWFKYVELEDLTAESATTAEE